MPVDPAAMANEAAASHGRAATAREVEVLLSANTGPFQDEMKKAGSAAGTVADALHKVEKALQTTLKRAGVGLMGLGAAFQGVATSAAWSAAKFEESFARVAKTTGLQNTQGQFLAAFGIGDDLQSFANDIRQLSTEIPVSVGELAHLADVAGQLGVESDNLTLYAKSAASLGAAITDLSSEQAVMGLTNLIEAFGDAPETITNLGSALADLANHTRGSANEMLYFSERLAGSAVQANMTSEQVLGLGAAVSAIGAQPQLGASAIDQFLQKISLAVQTGNEDLRRFATVLGMTREELKALWDEQGGAIVLQKFLQALNQQGQKATVTLEQLGLGGRGASQVLGGLAAQIGVVNDALGTAAESSEAGTALEELASIRFDTVIKALQRFRQSVAEVWRSLGVGFLPMMKAVINTASNFVNMFNALPQPLKTAMGLFAGLTGVVLTLGGAYVLLVGRLFPFLTAMSGVKMALELVTMGFHAAGAAMMRFAGVETIANTSRLSNVIATLGGTLARIPKLAGQAATWLGTTLMSAMKALASGIGTATKGVYVFLRAWVLHDMHTLNTMLAGMTKRILGIGTASGTAAVGVRALSLSLNTMLFAAGGVVAAIGGIAWLLSSIRGEADETALSMRELAEATGMVWQEMDALKDNLTDIGEAGFSEQARGVINQIQHIREVAGDAAAEDYMAYIGMSWTEMGNDPDEVKAQIDELARLADMPPIEIPYTFTEIVEGKSVEKSLEGFRQLTQGIGGAILGGAEAAGGKIDDPFWQLSDKPAEQFQKEFDAYLDAVAKAVGKDPGRRLAAQWDIQTQLDEALTEGLMEADVWRELNKQVEQANIAPGVTDKAGWFRRNITRRTASAGMELFGEAVSTGEARATLGSEGLLDFRGTLARAMEETSYLQDENWEPIREAIREVTGETENLAQAVLDLPDEGLEELADRFARIGVEAQIAARQAVIEDPNITNLERFIREGSQNLSEDQIKRFKQHTFETYQHQVGHVQALSEASTWLNRLVGTQDEWSEEADELRKFISSVSDEFAQMQIKSLDEELNALTAAEQVRHLQDEIRVLQGLGLGEDVIAPVVEEAMARMQRAQAQQVQEFRGLMDEYDRLIDQREELERSHTENLADLLEDRNESIADLRKDHQETLEEINEREKEALEERVEAQSRALDASEAMESQHAQSAARLNANMERQNRAMASAATGLQDLRRMGLGDEVIEALELDDPRNVDQIERLLQDAVANPNLIDQINATWAERLDISQAFVDEAEQVGGDSIREDFAEQRAKAEENLDERIAEINERYQENVADANERHAKQIENIGQALAALGDSTAQTVEELVGRAMESGLGGLQRWAQEIEAIQGEINAFMDEQQGRAEEIERAYRGIVESATNWADTVAEHPYVAANPYVSVAGPAPPRPKPQPSQERLDRAYGMADGGMLPDEATIRRGGTLIQWAEPETGGEAFIPLGPNKRDRSRSIWMETGKLLGMDVSRVAMANGGVLGSRTTGREPVGMSQNEMVGALVKALETTGPRQENTTTYGPIEVKATDARDLVRQLEARKRRSRLVGKKVHDG